MIARPAATALGCRTCRGAVLRAVLSTSAPANRSLPLQLSSARGVPNLVPRRLLSTDSHGASTESNLEKHDSKGASNEPLTQAEEEVLADTPWFLEVDPPRHVASDHKAELPKVPEDAPALLEPMLKYVYEDMGLDDLAMLDLRDLDPPAALGPNLIMLFGTARSERHLHVSSGRFVRFLRRNYKVNAKADGLIGPGELKTKLRRLRKKAKLLGTNTAIVPGGDNGISTGWICVNFSTHSTDAGEAVSFDESGRFSGFGTTPTGTTIVVQCMTEARRAELDLESLWQGVLKKSLEQANKINGEAAASRADLDALVASKVQLPGGFAATQWQAMKTASERHRYFSTMARQLRPSPSPAHGRQQDNSTAATESTTSGVDQWQKQLHEIQVAGLPIREEVLPDIISAIFRAPSDGTTASKRLKMLDELLLTAQERGMTIYSRDMLITMIESIVTCPEYGSELQRAQKNLEYLLRELDQPLEPAQVLRLMAAHAQRADWDRFWDVFRTPTRFNQRRSPDQYVLAYRVMAATGSSQLCTDALRWVYPEMLREEPPIFPTGSVYTSLKECIRVADPAAESMLQQGPPNEEDGVFGVRRWNQREVLKVLREVEQLHKEAVAVEARAARERLH
ncbi:ATPase synthesis protein 25 [Paramyrothecium foliicola]|nr:ATPase synthesis protein 25 [Paramyrothecium foliicola]